MGRSETVPVDLAGRGSGPEAPRRPLRPAAVGTADHDGRPTAVACRAPHRRRAALNLERSRSAAEGELDAQASACGRGAGQGSSEGDRPGKLLSPARGRAAVIMLQTRPGLSQRRACRVRRHGNVLLVRPTKWTLLDE